MELQGNLDEQLEQHAKDQKTKQATKTQRLYDQLRKINQFNHYTERAFTRACNQSQAASSAAIFVCLRYLVSYTRPSQTYHPTCGSYKLYVMIDKWAEETSRQKHQLTECAVIEACRLMELRMATEERNPTHMEIAFAFVWEDNT